MLVRLLITADGGGSNGFRSRLWKVSLQKLADDIGLELEVCHFPPGTSKWNKVEPFQLHHAKLEGTPLISRQVIVNSIASTSTKTELLVKAAIDTARYKKAIKVSDADLAKVRLTPQCFHGEWNYTISQR
jgi:hypothetical protein